MNSELDSTARWPHVETVEPLSAFRRFVTLVAIIVPFIALIVAIVGVWGWGFSWVDLVLLAVMYILTGLGITIGFHRLFTHRSFETIRPIKMLFAALGSMAVQGPMFRWVATHRRHHQHSDEPDDPHSPHGFGSGLFAVVTGWWNAQVGWILKPDAPGLERYVQDLNKDSLLRFVNNLFPFWVVLGLAIPATAGGLITGTWGGALLGFLWGGLVRVFLVHHVTWSINSVCHLWGSRPFQTRDESRNNVLCGVLAFGEGWHNNHHAFPNSARHGLRWWQIDTSYLVIRTLKWMGLAWQVRMPGREQLMLGSDN